MLFFILSIDLSSFTWNILNPGFLLSQTPSIVNGFFNGYGIGYDIGYAVYLIGYANIGA